MYSLGSQKIHSQGQEQGCATRRVQKRGYEHEQEKSTAGGVAGVIVGNEEKLRRKFVLPLGRKGRTGRRAVGHSPCRLGDGAEVVEGGGGTRERS